MAMNKALPGTPKGKPRGKPFTKGNRANPGGRPKDKLLAAAKRQQRDARLLAREYCEEAIYGLIALMRGVIKVKVRDETKPRAKKLTDVIVPTADMRLAMIALLDRGYGKPPQALEVFGGDVTPEEREGSALAIITRQLDLIAERERSETGPRTLN
jgi:hypothetical protein